ncbi:uncharacterized protein SPAPADRAFT_61137, partial [Spathaspora passalidarum NRRL Y-27907]
MTTDDINKATRIWSIIDGKLDLTRPTKRALVEFIICNDGSVYIGGSDVQCEIYPVQAENVEESSSSSESGTTVAPGTEEPQTTVAPGTEEPQTTVAPGTEEPQPADSGATQSGTDTEGGEVTEYTTITTDITITITDCDESDSCSTTESVKKTTIETYCPITVADNVHTITLTSCVEEICIEVTKVIGHHHHYHDTVSHLVANPTNAVPVPYVANSGNSAYVKNLFAVVAMIVPML